MFLYEQWFGKKNVTIFKRNALQVTKKYEIRLLPISAKNNTISVALLV